MTPGVTYRKVPGWPTHRVGSDGSVWNTWASSPWGYVRRRAWKRLATRAGNDYGHRALTLTWGGRRKDCWVHRLVLAAFVGPCPPGMQCRHLNGDGTDNRLENLAWGTPKENGADMVRHGRSRRGADNPAAKLTERGARRVLRLRRTTALSLQTIADRAGVSKKTVQGICDGSRWRHLTRA